MAKTSESPLGESTIRCEVPNSRKALGLAAALVAAGVFAQVALALASVADGTVGWAASGVLIATQLICAWQLCARVGSFWPALALAAVASVTNLFMVGLAFHLGTPDQGRLLVAIESKTLLFLLAALFAYVDRDRSQTLVARAAAVLILTALLQLARTQVGGVAGLGNLRNFIVPAAALFLIHASTSRGSRGSRAPADGTVPGVLLIIAALCVLGSLVEVLLGRARWAELTSQEGLAATKGLSGTRTDFFGVGFDRLGSLMVDPVNASYALSALAVYFAASRRVIPAGVLMVLAAGTLGKGGLLILLVAAAYLLAHFARQSNRATAIRPLLLAGAVLLALYGYLAATGISLLNVVLVSSNYGGGGNSAAVHVAGAASGLKAAILQPLGAGTGSGGNFVNLSGGLQDRSDWLGTGAESGLGTLAFQLGLVGVAAFLAAAFGALRAILATPGADQLKRNLAYCAVVGWLCGTVLQENALGPQAYVVLTLCIYALLQPPHAATSLETERR